MDEGSRSAVEHLLWIRSSTPSKIKKIMKSNEKNKQTNKKKEVLLILNPWAEHRKYLWQGLPWMDDGFIFCCYVLRDLSSSVTSGTSHHRSSVPSTIKGHWINQWCLFFQRKKHLVIFSSSSEYGILVSHLGDTGVNILDAFLNKFGKKKKFHRWSHSHGVVTTAFSKGHRRIVWSPNRTQAICCPKAFVFHSLSALPDMHILTSHQL
jgi:hypothetical protein